MHDNLKRMIKCKSIVYSVKMTIAKHGTKAVSTSVSRSHRFVSVRGRYQGAITLYRRHSNSALQGYDNKSSHHGVRSKRESRSHRSRAALFYHIFLKECFRFNRGIVMFTPNILGFLMRSFVIVRIRRESCRSGIVIPPGVEEEIKARAANMASDLKEKLCMPAWHSRRGRPKEKPHGCMTSKKEHAPICTRIVNLKRILHPCHDNSGLGTSN